MKIITKRKITGYSRLLLNRVFATGYSGQAKAINDLGGSFSEAWSIDGVFTGDVHDVAMDRQGNVYIVNSNKIYKYQQTESGVEQVWIYTFSEASLMRNIFVDKNGFIYTASFNTNHVIKLREVGGTPERVWTYNWSGSAGVVDLTVDNNGYVLVGEHQGTNVRLISPSGTLVWAHSQSGATWCRAVAFDTAGEAYALWESGHFKRLARADGAQVWDYTGFSGQPMYALNVTKTKKFFLIGDTGTLYKMSEPTPNTTPTVVWSTDISGASTGFNGLGHKIAMRPDESEWYVAMYGDVAGVFKMREVSGSPQIVWQDNDFTDHVRSVRILPQFIGVTPEEYGLN